MFRKTLFIMLLMLTVSSYNQLEAQTLVIRQKNGSANTELLSSLQKLSFIGSNLKVSFKSGTTTNYILSQIQKLSFTTITAVTEPVVMDEKAFTIFPNPAEVELHLQNIPDGTSIIYIYRMDGKMVLQTSVSGSTETINISNLQSGMYMLLAKNQSVKFIKS